jgi:hypothetical protein
MGLFSYPKERNALNQAVVDLKGEIADLKAEREAQRKQTKAFGDAVGLKQEIEDLKIGKARLIEDNERREREVLHMVGLERKRQEFEAEEAKKGIETAKKDAVLAVREENLKTEKDAFDKQMKFQKDAFDKEVGYLQNLMGQILERLPTVTVERKITESKRSE